jgi:hypothetical protein
MKKGYIITTQRQGGGVIDHPDPVYDSIEEVQSVLKAFRNKLPGHRYSYREIEIPDSDVEKQ